VLHDKNEKLAGAGHKFCCLFKSLLLVDLLINRSKLVSFLKCQFSRRMLIFKLKYSFRVTKGFSRISLLDQCRFFIFKSRRLPLGLFRWPFMSMTLSMSVFMSISMSVSMPFSVYMSCDCIHVPVWIASDDDGTRGWWYYCRRWLWEGRTMLRVASIDGI
jgi:hypothetical protein